MKGVCAGLRQEKVAQYGHAINGLDADAGRIVGKGAGGKGERDGRIIVGGRVTAKPGEIPSVSPVLVAEST